MKAIINPSGWLVLDRGVSAESMKLMSCPFATPIDAACGDWCPHFDVIPASDGRAMLMLCHGKRMAFEPGELEDRRP